MIKKLLYLPTGVSPIESGAGILKYPKRCLVEIRSTYYIAVFRRASSVMEGLIIELKFR
jgi:hypothetical protein